MNLHTKMDLTIEKNMYKDFFVNGGTEDFDIVKELHIENYDSKTAARMFHIESLSYEAYEFITKSNEYLGSYAADRAYRNNNDETSHNESLKKCDTVYCIFDYEHRDSHTKDAYVAFLNKL